MSRRSKSDDEKMQEHVNSQRQLLHCLNEQCGWTGPRALADDGDKCPNCGKEAEADDTDHTGVCSCKDCRRVEVPS